VFDNFVETVRYCLSVSVFPMWSFRLAGLSVYVIWNTLQEVRMSCCRWIDIGWYEVVCMRACVSNTWLTICVNDSVFCLSGTVLQIPVAGD